MYLCVNHATPSILIKAMTVVRILITIINLKHFC